MIFKQFQHEEGACLSYILGCTAKRVCAVFEPQLDIEQYLEYAKAKGMEITHIFETHAQADHLSGAMRLAELTRAPVHYHESVNAAFPVTKLRDGETINVGNIQLRILHTPGHTPDSTSILVTDATRNREPQEYEICILGAHLIPLRQLPKRHKELDPNKEIVVYCHTGSRSQQAVEFLYESGFKNVKSLVGGVEAWAQKIDLSMPRY